MGVWANLKGTVESTFGIGKNKALFDTAGLTALRTFGLPDTSGTLVVGPSSSVDNAITRFDATTGKIIQSSDLFVSDLSGSSVSLFTSAGTALVLLATDAAPTVGASQAGKLASLSASNAVASTNTAGAAVGGSASIFGGNAARLTSGNAAGGDVNLVPGLGIGTANAGSVWIRKPTSPSSSQLLVAALKMRAPVNETQSRFISFYGADDTTETGFISSNAGNTGLLIDLSTVNASSSLRCGYASGGLFATTTIQQMGATYKLGWGPVNAYDTPDTLFGRSIANGVVVSATGVAGSAVSRNEVNKLFTGIANAVGTGVLTITVPNSAQSCQVYVEVCGSLGAGGAIGANEATATNCYTITITRTAGVNAVAQISTASGASAVAVAGAATVTCTAAMSAVSGAVGASNTFTVNTTISRSGGSSTNHTCLVYAKLMNANATGVTIA